MKEVLRFILALGVITTIALLVANCVGTQIATL